MFELIWISAVLTFRAKKKTIGIDVFVCAHIGVNNVEQQAVPFSVLQCGNMI